MVARIVVLAQTSVRLFQTAAVAVFGRYGDQTDGAFTAAYGGNRGNTAELRYGSLERCPNCRNEIPSFYKFCAECGHKL